MNGVQFRTASFGITPQYKSNALPVSEMVSQSVEPRFGKNDNKGSLFAIIGGFVAAAGALIFGAAKAREWDEKNPSATVKADDEDKGPDKTE